MVFVSPIVQDAGGELMIRPPDGMGAYMFAVLSSLRSVQLMRGCVPRVEVAGHKSTVVAQLEVSRGESRAMEEGEEQPAAAPAAGAAEAEDA